MREKEEHKNKDTTYDNNKLPLNSQNMGEMEANDGLMYILASLIKVNCCLVIDSSYSSNTKKNKGKRKN